MQKADKPRVVIDTNLVISTIIIAGGLPNQLLQAWKKDFYTLVISNEILEEIKEVLQRDCLQEKYHFIPEKTVPLITMLKFSAELARPLSEEDLPVHCRDIKDDKLLTLAMGGEADYLVTGDKDLLVLNGNPKLKKLKIITAKKFLSILSYRNNRN